MFYNLSWPAHAASVTNQAQFPSRGMVNLLDLSIHVAQSAADQHKVKLMLLKGQKVGIKV